jgi:hypothetical protein
VAVINPIVDLIQAMEEVTKVADDLAKEEKRIRNKKLQEWRDDICEGGAGMAHRLTKAPSIWRAQVVNGPDGCTGNPVKVMACEREALKELWHGGDGPEAQSCLQYDWPLGHEIDIWEEYRLTKITGPELRKAGKSFKTRTTATDGWHPRHLAEILNAVELLGDFPMQLRDVLIHLMDKPTGGTRPIGWYRAMFRLWARARRYSGSVGRRTRTRTRCSGQARIELQTI